MNAFIMLTIFWLFQFNAKVRSNQISKWKAKCDTNSMVNAVFYLLITLCGALKYTNFVKLAFIGLDVLYVMYS